MTRAALCSCFILLRDHRARLGDWIGQLQASGRTLDDKITRYETLLEK